VRLNGGHHLGDSARALPDSAIFGLVILDSAIPDRRFSGGRVCVGGLARAAARGLLADEIRRLRRALHVGPTDDERRAQTRARVRRHRARLRWARS
jgi:hypothetical protein